MDSYFIKEFFRQDLQDFLDFFPGFPEESLEPLSPSANILTFKQLIALVENLGPMVK